MKYNKNYINLKKYLRLVWPAVVLDKRERVPELPKEQMFEKLEWRLARQSAKEKQKEALLGSWPQKLVFYSTAFGCALLLFGFFLFAAYKVVKHPQLVKVFKVQGDAALVTQGVVTPLKDNSFIRLASGDKIVTANNGIVLLSLKQSLIRVGKRSSLEFVNLELSKSEGRAEIELTEGIAGFRVSGLDNFSRFTVKSGQESYDFYPNVFPKGFIVDKMQKETYIAALEGESEVSGCFGTIKVKKAKELEFANIFTLANKDILDKCIEVYPAIFWELDPQRQEKFSWF
jgi:hypothetical protein